MRRSLLALLLALLTGLAGLTAADAAPTSGWTARAEEHPGSVTETDVEVPMSDGTVLRADVRRPADAEGNPVEGRFPVLLTITAYNKSIISGPGAAAIDSDPDFFVKRGYVHVTVDARGTGSSAGDWQAFSARENTDSGEIVNWAASPERPWSNGAVGMHGASYMGISQLFAAGNRPPGLKAIFPQVPAVDTYRDVVASGGALDVGFIPLWMGLVTGTGLIPPAYGPAEPDNALQMYLDRVQGATSFTAPTLLEATLGLNAAFDGPFYAERSPASVLDRIDVPTFLVGGEYDLFQRGTPMVFDSLRQRGVPVKMIFGPWDHMQGSGDGIAEAGHGTLQELQLRWFDHHVRGQADPSLDTDIPPLTYHEIGSGQWFEADQWIGEQRARSFQLSGTSLPGLPGGLVDSDPQPGRSTVAPLPVSGLCTRSTNQWTAGMPNAIGIAQLCHDNRWNDLSGAVFETEPMTEAMRMRGPINAHLHASTPTGNGMLSVSVSSVAPDGAVNRLTGGWQVLSHRALDESRSRYLDGELIQPFHPFTEEAQRTMEPGEVEPVDVEVFPTAAVIPPGHKLRISVQAFDVPHLLPTVRDLPAALSPVAIHNSPEHPSEITLPVIPATEGTR